jgi:hypothetical protein
MRVRRPAQGVRDSGHVPLSDTILFELRRRSAAADLCRRLRLRWCESLEEDNGRWIVIAELRPEIGDLALLLRTVQAWIAERGLDELWFLLDGRTYLLTPTPGVPTTARAA